MADIVINPLVGKIDFFAVKGDNVTNTLKLTGNTLLVTGPLSASSISTGGGGSFVTSVQPTANYLSKFTGNSTIANSLIYDNATNIGIGTSSPLSRLHVSSTTSGTTLLRADGTSGTLFSVTDDLNDSLMSVNNSAGLPVFEVFADDRIVGGQYGRNDFVIVNNKVGIGTNNPIAELHVTSSTSVPSAAFLGGNVGVGTTNPIYSLDIPTTSALTRVGSALIGSWPTTTSLGMFGNSALDQTNASNYALLQSNQGITYLNAASGQSLRLRIANADKLIIDSGGNVGIGTTSFVYGSANRGLVELYGSSDALLALRNSTGNLYIQKTSVDVYINNTNSGVMSFATSNVQRMVIFSGGSVSFGSAADLLGSPGNIYLNGNTGNAAGPALAFGQSDSVTGGIGHLARITGGGTSQDIFIQSQGASNSIGLNANPSGAAIYFQTQGAEKARITAAGNLGIGTSTPATKVDIYGPVSVRGTTVLTTNFDLNAGNAADIYGNIRVLRGASLSDGMYIGYGGAGGNLKFFSNSGTTEFMTIATTGNVGIGSTSPGYKLDVNGVTRFQSVIRLKNDAWNVTDSDSQARFYFDVNGRTYFGSGNGYEWRSQADAALMVLTNAGNVGVGTTSPITKFDVRSGYITTGTGTSTSGTIMMGGYYGDGNLTILGTEYSSGGPMLGYGVTPSTTSAGAFLSSTGVNVYRSAYVQDGGTHRWYIGAVQTVAIGSAVSASERMRINADGNLGIGTSSPRQILHINGSILLDGIQNGYEQGSTRAIGYGSNNGAVNTDGFSGMDIQSVNAPAPNGGNYSQNVRFWAHHYGTGTGNTPRMVIQYNGNVGIGTTSPTALLHVNGTTRFGSSTSSTQAITGSLNVTGSITLNTSKDSNWPFLISDPSTSGGNSRYQLGKVGAMGFNYADSYAQLQLIGANGAYIDFGNASGDDMDARIFYVTNTRLQIEYGTTLALNSTGLGIGTSSPNTKLESYFSSNSLTFNYLATNLNVNSPIPVYSFDVTSGSETRSIKAGIGYERHLTNGRGTLHFYNDSVDDTSNISGNRSSAGDIKMSIDNAGNVGIGTTVPNFKFEIGAGSSNVVVAKLTQGYERVRYYGFDLLGYNDGNLWMIGNNATNGLILGSNWDWDAQAGIYYTPGTYGAAGGSLEIGQLTKNNANFTHGNTRFYTNGVERVRIISTGNVGIGTSSPGAPLTIYKASNPWMRINGGGAFSYIQMDDGTSYGYLFKNTTSDTSNGALAGAMYTYTDSGKAFQHIHSGVPLFTILSGGNVGIGTSSPAYKLDVNGTGRFTGDLTTNGNIVIARAGAYLYINGTNSDAEIVWQTNGGNRWAAGMNVGDATENFNIYNYTTSTTNFTILKTNGNVGIGSTAPAYKLDVNGTFNASGTSTLAAVSITGTINSSVTEVIRVNNNNGYISFYNTAGNTRTGYLQGNTGSDMLLASENGAAIRFAVGGSEVSRISTTGNVGIGTTSPGTKLAVNGVSSFGLSSKLSMIGLDINSSGTPTYIKIVTTIPVASPSADFTVNIKGFIYGAVRNADISISWHYYLSTFYNPIAKSSGGWAPTIRLSAEGGFVAIVLSSPGYWPKFYVESMYSSAYTNQYASGWSWTDADATGNPIVNVPYANNFGNGFVMLTDGNVGIGTTSPASLLQVGGSSGATATPTAITFDNTYRNAVGGNTSLKIYLYKSGGETYGFGLNNAGGIEYHVGASGGSTANHAFYTETTEKVRINSAGNLGIGTTAPANKLQVVGDIGFSGGTSTRMLVSYTNLTDNEDWQNSPISIRERDLVGNAQSADKYGPNINFHWANRVSYSLWVNANGILNWGDYSAAGIPAADGIFRLASLQASANIGIGTTSPGDKLHVNLGAGENIIANITSTSVSAANKISYRLLELGTALGEFSAVRDGTSYQVKLQTLTSSPLSFGTNTTTRMVLDSNGNLGIGSTAPGALLNIRASTPTSTGTVTTGTNVLIDSNTNNYITFRNTADNGTYAGLTFLDNNTGGYIVFRNYTGDVAGGSDSMIYGTYQDHIFQNGSSETINGKTETMRIKGNGNVGIGSSSPGYKLDVVGDIGFSSTLKFGGINVISNAGGDVYINGRVIRNESVTLTDGMYIGYGNSGTTNGHLRFYANNQTERMRIDASSGNVGIATTSPYSKLTVAVPATNTISTADNANTAGLTISGTGGLVRLQFGVGSSTLGPYGGWIQASYDNTGGNNGLEPLLLNPVGGNVGIGTTSPTSKLNVYDASSGSADEVFIGTIGSDQLVGGRSGGSFGIATKSASNGNLILTANTGMYFRTGGSNDRMFIKNDGNVGIGSSSPAYKLDVNGTIGLSGRPFAYSSGTYTGIYEPAGNVAIYLGNASDTANYYDNNSHIFRSRAGSTNYAIIEGNGNLGIGTTSVTEAIHVYRAANAIIRLQAGGGNVSGVRMDDASSAGYLLKNRSSDTSNNALAGALYTYTDNNKAFQHIHNGTPLFTILSGGNVGIGTNGPAEKLQVLGGIKIGNKLYEVPIDTLSASGTQAQRFEIARVFIDYNDWNQTGPVEIEVRENYYSDGFFKRYVFSYGYNSSNVGRLFLVESNGSSSTDCRVVIGAAVQTSGDIYYVPIYVELDYYARADALVRTNRDRTTNASSTSGGVIYINSGPTGTNISSFDSDEVTYVSAYASKTNLGNSGNVGIGTTNPTAKLHIAQTNSGGIPAIRLSEDESTIQGPSANTQIRMGSNLVLNASNVMPFNVNASETMRIINNGNIGIGTTTPLGKLHVYGLLRVGGAANEQTGIIALGNDANAVGTYGDNGMFRGGIGTLGSANYTNISSYQGIVFNVGNAGFGSQATRMLIDVNGNVGIGTTSPSARLHVLDSNQSPATGNLLVTSTGGNASIRIDSNSTSNYTYFTLSQGGAGKFELGIVPTTSDLYINPNVQSGPNGAAIYIKKSDGNVGIGTTSPIYKFQVVGSTYVNNGTLFIDSGNILSWGNSAQYILGTNGVGLTFVAGSATRMFIANDGNVGIGTTAPVAKLHVNSTTAGSTVVRADGTSGTLFSVVDDLTDSLMSVNNSAGLPVFEVFADDRIVGGQYGANDFVITNNRVGIGTSNPLAELHVTGSSTTPAALFFGNVGIGTTSFLYPTATRGLLEIYGSADSIIALKHASTHAYFHKAGNDFYLVNGGAGTISIYNNGSERMQINSSGNVGIGTTTINSPLSVYNNSDVWHFRLGGASGELRMGGQTNSGAVIQAYTPGGTVRDLYIQRDGGNIGVGLNNPSVKVHIYENANRVTYITQNNNHTARFEAYGTATAIDTTASNGIFFRINGGDIVKFAADGNVGIGTSSPTALLHVNGGSILGTSGPTLSFNGNTCTAASYNYVMGASNDGGNKLVIFVNGSARTDDGGVNALTIRNDGGPFVLGQASYLTSILGSSVTINSNVALHAGNYTSYAVGLTTSNTITGINTQYNETNTFINNVTHGNRALTLYQPTAGADAYLTFHIGGDFAAYFGLGGAENDLVYGGWSVGNVRYRILHSGNASYAWNMNQNVRTSDTCSFAAVTATTFTGALAGNATTATNLSTNRTNWSTNGTITAVVGQLSWKNYGNGHTIIDASNATSPAGGAINNTNPDVAWTGTYPTLMGWNGSNTYGVRVDSSRYADNVSYAPSRTDSTAYPVLWGAGTSWTIAYSCAAVTIQSSTGTLTATTFSGAGTGLTGTAASLNVGGTAGSISGFNNPATAATASTIAYRDSSADLTTRYFLANRTSAGASQCGIQLQTGGTTKWWMYLRQSDDNVLAFYTSNATADDIVRMTSTGLGIKVDPSNRLHINGDNTNPAIRVDNGAVAVTSSSSGASLYGWLPISIAGTTRWIQLWNR